MLSSGLLFQYKKEYETAKCCHKMIEKKYKNKEPTKKEQKELDMIKQKSIDDSWN